MCEASAYLISKDKSEPELIMESVDTVDHEDGGLKLVSIFGDQKFIDAEIHSLSLVDHRIYLKHK